AALLASGRGADPTLVEPLVTPGVLHARPDAVQPGALVLLAWRGERRAAELLGVKTVIDLLGGVAADRQGAGQRLGFEAVAETGHVLRGHGSSFDPVAAWSGMRARP